MLDFALVDYKLSFDPNKGDKYTIKVVYTVAMDA